METVDEALAHVLVDEGVVHDIVGPLGQLIAVGKLAVQQQIRDFEVRALLRQLLDRVAPVAQDTGLAIEVSDRALGRRRLHVGRVVDEERRIELANARGRKCSVCDRNGDGLAGAVVGDGDGLGHADSLYFFSFPRRSGYSGTA